MSEKELRDGLAGALVGEPPLDFDPDRLMARAQREVRRRRSLVGVGAATAVIAVAAATTATVLHPTDEAAPAAHLSTRTSTPTQVSTTTSASLPAWPPPVRETHYSVAREKQLAAAWTSHIGSEFTQVVPKARNVSVQPWGGEAVGQVSADQDYLDTFVTFTLDGTATAVDISVFAPGQNSTGPQGDCKSPCAATPLPDGSVLTVDPFTQRSLRLLTVTQYRPDGSVVSATGYNYEPTGKNVTSPADGAAVLLNIQQLTAFATDHAFAFTP